MSSRPTHEVFLVTKEAQQGGKRKHTKIGACWPIFNGASLSLTLNTGTVLDWRLQEDHYINIRPAHECDDYTGAYEK